MQHDLTIALRNLYDAQERWDKAEAEKRNEMAELKAAILAGANLVAALPNDDEKLQLVLECYDLPGAPKQVLAKAVGLTCREINWMLRSAIVKHHCRVCDSHIPTTRGNFDRKEITCEACQRQAAEAYDRQQEEWRRERQERERQEAEAEAKAEEWVQNECKNILQSHAKHLSAWETEFVASLMGRSNTSQKQRQVLNRIIGKVNAIWDALSQQQPQQQPPEPKEQPKDDNVIPFPGGAA